MDIKKKLLIIDKHPVGRLVDVVKWCEYARNHYDITLLCFDDEKRLNIDGINIIRVSNSGNRIIRGLRYIYTAIKTVKQFKGKIFVVYFENCSLLKLMFPARKMHVDVRTFSISKDDNARCKYDKKLIRECKRFDSVSTLSSGIKEKLGIKDAKLLPLGADVISDVKKNYTESIRLLYVGTLNNRNIDQTIRGLSIFTKKHPDINVIYDIIGDGQPSEVTKVRNAIINENLRDVVHMRGRIEHKDLKPFFDKANVGVSYVPVTEYYQYQPPTKTYEYISSGLYCIATNTAENRRIINNENGVLIEDTANSFAEGLEYFFKIRENLIDSQIRTNASQYSWKNITDVYLTELLNEI